MVFSSPELRNACVEGTSNCEVTRYVHYVASSEEVGTRKFLGDVLNTSFERYCWSVVRLTLTVAQELLII